MKKSKLLKRLASHRKLTLITCIIMCAVLIPNPLLLGAGLLGSVWVYAMLKECK